MAGGGLQKTWGGGGHKITAPFYGGGGHKITSSSDGGVTK